MKGFFSAVSVFFFGALARALAAGSGGGGGNITITNPLGCNNFGCVATKITDALLAVSAPIVAIMVLWGGFQMMTAGGNPEKFSMGRKTLLYAAIGFVVVLLADSAANIIQNLF